MIVAEYSSKNNGSSRLGKGKSKIFMILIQKKFNNHIATILIVLSLKLIGSGSYGTVIKATLKQTKIKRAIKIIPKNKVKNPERFKSEIDIMRKLVIFK